MLNKNSVIKSNLQVYLLVWSALLFIHFTIIYFEIELSLEAALADSLVFNIMYIIIGASFWYPVKYMSIDIYSTPRLILNHLAAALITTALWLTACYFILTNLFEFSESYYKFLVSSLIWRYAIGILFYAVIVSIIYVYVIYSGYKEKELNESNLKVLVKEAELKSLKYQINPHFIFNSLNSISSLTMSNPERAQEMTIKLSEFMRSTVSKNEMQKTPLTEEIKNARLYLEIEKVRFEDKFEYIENISEACEKIKVPSMILQPIFENAIKHGVYESIEKVIITLTCKEENNYLKITVENNFDIDAVPRKGEGIGLQNIKNRLKLIYNHENLITYSKEKNIFRVNIYIPLQKEVI
ncbi:MAG: histidine kinase [Ignavibacteria bacterium]